MTDGPATNDPAVAEIQASLNRQPVLLDGFNRCLEQLVGVPGTALAAHGSLQTGQIDAYSDLDFAIVAPPGADLTALASTVHARMADISGLLASFPATHIGLETLQIFFFDACDAVVKADIIVLDATSFAGFAGYVVLSDPTGVLASLPTDSAASGPKAGRPDLEDLAQKFCGWIWYSYSKIARGELFEAYDSLGTMRGYALLPMIQADLGLPHEGYRWLEIRLPEETAQALARTIPAGFDRAQLLAALNDTVALFQRHAPSALAKVGGVDITPQIDRMWKIVDAHERS